eukprot:TRINITY_DN188_c3_g1_i1.p1 TRINITY_DN188_c3_g1~~TRINITY_DN188_c3_g1_i1.p1  ORF type:complete len:1205 (+),score=279.57 TRINITY_DN188_c3_g1_i1:448-4062(+)
MGSKHSKSRKQTIGGDGDTGDDKFGPRSMSDSNLAADGTASPKFERYIKQPVSPNRATSSAGSLSPQSSSGGSGIGRSGSSSPTRSGTSSSSGTSSPGGSRRLRRSQSRGSARESSSASPPSTSPPTSPSKRRRKQGARSRSPSSAKPSGSTSPTRARRAKSAPNCGPSSEVVQVARPSTPVTPAQELAARMETSLKTRLLDLETKNLTAVPEGVSDLHSLTSLNLSNNRIADLPVETFASLTNLVTLRINNNKLTLVPDVSALCDLQRLDLGKNRLHSLDPVRLSGMGEIARLDLHCNHLCDLPMELGCLTSLKVLDLSTNHLSSLPSSMEALGDVLQTLDIDNNELTTLPNTMSKLKRLTRLQCAHNRFKEFPPALYSLSGLEKLDMRMNLLESIPPEIAGMDGLSQINLSRNKIHTFPSSIGCLQRLTTINLVKNEISSFPEETDFTLLTELTYFHLSHNNLTQLTSEVCKLTVLMELGLSHNHLTELPAALGSLTYLSKLNASNNQISIVPDELAGMEFLNELYLSNNLLDVVPRFVTAFGSLKTLDLAGNRLRSLPDYIGSLVQLRALDVSRNLLTALPESVSQLNRLELLNISENRIAELPPAILTGLRELSQFLAADNLISRIPPTVSSLRKLDELTLSGNKLRALPDALGKLVELKELYLGRNRLGQTVPPVIMQLRSLLKLDLSANGLTRLPEELFSLKNLRELSLACNQLNELSASVEKLSLVAQLTINHNRLRDLPHSALVRLKERAAIPMLCGNLIAADALPAEMDWLRGQFDTEVPKGADAASSAWDIDDDALNATGEESDNAWSRSCGRAGTWSGVCTMIGRRMRMEDASLVHEGAPTGDDVDEGSLLRGSAHHGQHSPHHQDGQGQTSPRGRQRRPSMGARESPRRGNTPPSCDGGLSSGSSSAFTGSMSPSTHVLGDDATNTDGDVVVIDGNNLASPRTNCPNKIALPPTAPGGAMSAWPREQRHPHDVFAAVLDGHGGWKTVRYAARNLHVIFRKRLESPVRGGPARCLREEFADVVASCSKNGDGSTAVAAYLQWPRLWSANLGDSRMIMSKAGKAIAISEDHTPSLPAEEKRIQGKGGFITSGRVNGILAVSRALGDGSLIPYVSSVPDIEEHILTEEDEFLILACDGLWDTVTNQEAIDLARSEPNPYLAAMRLRDRAYLTGSTDNITVAVVHLKNFKPVSRWE